MDRKYITFIAMTENQSEQIIKIATDLSIAKEKVLDMVFDNGINNYNSEKIVAPGDAVIYTGVKLKHDIYKKYTDILEQKFNVSKGVHTEIIQIGLNNLYN